MKEINYLARRLGVPTSSLRQALTHYSYFEDKESPDSNSRYVFAGMFVFRGILAETLYKLVPATGTQLQHALGNMVSNQQMENLFETLKLRQFVRVGNNFDIKTHRHIFTYGLLGCICTECDDEETLKRFISNHFIKPSQHIFFHKPKNRDYRTQADALAKQMAGKALLLETKMVNDTFVSTICIKDGEQLAQAQSKSYRYSRSKALKIAIRFMSDKLMDDFDKGSTYYRRLLERAGKDEEQRLSEKAKKQQEKELKRKEREDERKRKAAARDVARRKAQSEAKERKKRKSEVEAKKAEKASRPMSANKRRHLEDKAK